MLPTRCTLLPSDEPTDGSQALVRGLRLAGCGNGALEVEGFDTVRLANLTIHGNGRRRAAHDTEHSGSGGGIWLARVGARAVLEHVRCTDNEAVYGGCLATKHIESLLEIRDSVFSGNTARDQVRSSRCRLPDCMAAQGMGAAQQLALSDARCRLHRRGLPTTPGLALPASSRLAAF